MGLRKTSSGLLVPTKNGTNTVAVTVRFDPEFKIAVEMLAKELSEEEGLKVSTATLLMNLALAQSPKLTKTFKELKKEANDGIRSEISRPRRWGDSIRRSRSRGDKNK